MDECPVCNSESVVEEEENGQTVRVCTECGAMDKDMQVFTSGDNFEGMTQTFGEGKAPDTAKSWMKGRSSAAKKAKIIAAKLIKHIANVFNLGEDIMQQAVALYDRIYEETLIHCTWDKRRIMCVACLYSMARVNDRGLNLRMIAGYLEVENAAVIFGVCLKTLKIKYDIHLPLNNVKTESHNLLSKAQFPQALIKQTQEVMMLMENSWITSGRSLSTCIVAAAFIVWRASDYLKYNKLSLPNFAKKFQFQMSRAAYNRLNELKSVLLSMVKELPWITCMQDMPTDVEPYLSDCLKYQGTLFKTAVATTIQEIKNFNAEEEVDSSDEDDKTEQKLSNEELEVKEEYGSIFRKPSVNKKRKDCSELEQEHEEFDRLEERLQRKKKLKEMTNETLSSPRKNNSDYSSDNSGVESLDLGSDDDTDLYILPAHEVLQRTAMYKRIAGTKKEYSDKSDV